MNNTVIIAFGDFLKPGTYHFHSGFEHIDNYVNQRDEFISLAADISFLAPNSIIISDFISGKYLQVVIGDDSAHFAGKKPLLLPARTPFIPLKERPNTEFVSGFPFRRCIAMHRACRSEHVEMGQRGVRGENQKHILNKELQHSSAFKYPEINFSTLESRIHAFINLYASDFPSKSLFFLLHPKNKKHFTSAFERAFVQQMAYAFSLFKSQFYESIKAFKSRGSGLTPSGDDFIAGVLFGIDYLENTKGISFNKTKDNIYEISKSNNIFSNNMLRMAYHAKYFKRFHDFLNAFFYLPLENVSPSFKQLIAVGDTSGADLLTGFLAVILKRTVQ